MGFKRHHVSQKAVQSILNANKIPFASFSIPYKADNGQFRQFLHVYFHNEVELKQQLQRSNIVVFDTQQNVTIMQFVEPNKKKNENTETKVRRLSKHSHNLLISRYRNALDNPTMNTLLNRVRYTITFASNILTQPLRSELDLSYQCPPNLSCSFS